MPSLRRAWRQAVDHAVRIAERHGRRLFAEDVLAGLGGGHHGIGVQRVGSNDGDDVDLRVGQHRVQGGVNLGLGGEVVGQLLGPLLLYVADRHEFRLCRVP